MADFPGHPKFRRIRHSMSELVPLGQYCSSEHITRSTGMNRIGKERVVGYKVSGRWYVVPTTATTFDT